MDYYNLQESVSESCYNDIVNMVIENLAENEVIIDEEHLADAIEKIGQKHAPGLIKSAVTGVGKAVSNAGAAAGDALLKSDNKIANFIKKIPGINGALKRRNAANLTRGIKTARERFNSANDKATAKHQKQAYMANYSANPAQANAANNREYQDTLMRNYQNKQAKIQAEKDKFNQYKKNL